MSEANGGQPLSSSKIHITNKITKTKGTSEDGAPTHTLETLAGYAVAQMPEHQDISASDANAQATFHVTAASVVERTLPKVASGGDDVLFDRQFYFSIKLTDISELSNPFVIFDDRPIKKDGFLYLTDRQALKDAKPLLGSSECESPCSLFPWLRRQSDVKHRTFKIEVIY
jgi:hypothetical protein